MFVGIKNKQVSMKFQSFLFEQVQAWKPNKWSLIDLIDRQIWSFMNIWLR